MELRNKKTGEIGYLIVGRGSDHYVVANNEWSSCGKYGSLAELNEEWEDYEEPKEYYAIDLQGDIIRWARHSWDEKTTNKIKEIGNYFDAREEAEKAVEKLKAWKRLKDKGFRFDRWNYASSDSYKPIWFYFEKGTVLEDIKSDLDLLFGGKE